MYDVSIIKLCKGFAKVWNLTVINFRVKFSQHIRQFLTIKSAIV